MSLVTLKRTERVALLLQALTGERQAVQGSMKLLKQYHSTLKWVVVKFAGRGSMLVHLCPETQTVVETRQDSFHVHVADTVGCGDSFAAAVRTLWIS